MPTSFKDYLVRYEISDLFCNDVVVTYFHLHADPASLKNLSCCGHTMLTIILTYFGSIVHPVLLIALPHLELLGSLEQ